MPFLDPNRPVPHGMRTEDFVLRPILASDAERDHAAVMETRVELRLWEQTAWPEDDFTVEANRVERVSKTIDQPWTKLIHGFDQCVDVDLAEAFADSIQRCPDAF